jgi:hypothetical protein
MAIIKANKSAKAKEVKPKYKSANEPVSDDAMERLARLMNDSPTTIKLKGTEWELHALRVGTQWLICEEACQIVKKEGLTAGDVLKELAANLPSVCRVITLAILNDKEKIYGKEYDELYDTLLWGDYDVRDWSQLLMEILNLIDVDFFFASTDVIQTIRTNALKRKTTMKELRQSMPEPNGER